MIEHWELEELKSDVVKQQKFIIPREEILDNLDRYLTCTLYIGLRVWWYFVDDLKFAVKHQMQPRIDAPYSGLVVPIPSVEIPGHGEIAMEDAVVIVDTYPTEKCYPETAWVAMGHLLDLPNLVEVFTKSETTKNDLKGSQIV